MNYTCDTCGRIGSEDDGITAPDDDCPDEECPGSVRWTGPTSRFLVEIRLLNDIDPPTVYDVHDCLDGSGSWRAPYDGLNVTEAP